MKKIFQWTCPCCGGENLTYDAIELEGDQCYFPRTCEKCGAKWEEWYNMDFIWHENVEKPILSDNQKENVWENFTE